jgi:hypothetical protein
MTTLSPSPPTRAHAHTRTRTHAHTRSRVPEPRRRPMREHCCTRGRHDAEGKLQRCVATGCSDARHLRVGHHLHVRAWHAVYDHCGCSGQARPCYSQGRTAQGGALLGAYARYERRGALATQHTGGSTKQTETETPAQSMTVTTQVITVTTAQASVVCGAAAHPKPGVHNTYTACASRQSALWDAWVRRFC